MARAFTEIPYDDIEFLELVGGGRFGSVYKAKWHDKIVAVKKTLCFDQEAMLLASLRHRNIITFFGACTAAPNSFLVTEYAEHGSLYNFLENVETLEVHLIRNWLVDIARGLRYLHHEAPKRIIHRDLKSLNVLVCEDERENLVLKICDFGSSRQVSRDTKSVTSAGTVSWMAPEVIRNEHVTEKCDVWSFGVIAWELVTLEVPYAGMEPYSVLWLVAKHGMSLHIPQTCPSRLSDLMKVCMAQNPCDRPTFDTIVRLLDDMRSDDATFSELRRFMSAKVEWLSELEKITESYSSLEANSALLAAQRADIERREAAIRLREEALRLQLHSDSFIANQVATPNTPHQDALMSKFSSDVPARYWNTEQVVAWVSVLPDGLSQYADVFRDNAINGEVLIKLTDEALMNALGMKPFGHRFRFLELVRNIQKSSEFPPLSSLANDEPIVVNEDVIVSFIYVYKPNPVRESFEFLLRPEQEIHLAYIQQVEFVLSVPTRPENELQVCRNPPFEYSGASPPAGERATLMLRITYQTRLFRRKTTKRTFSIDGNTRMDTFSERLLPKFAHLRVQPASSARSQQQQAPSSSSSQQQALAAMSTASSASDTATTLSRATSSTAPKVPSSPGPRPTGGMVLRNDNPWFNAAARQSLASNPPRTSSVKGKGKGKGKGKAATILVGAQYPVLPGPGVGVNYQLRQRSDSATSTTSAVSYRSVSREPSATSAAQRTRARRASSSVVPGGGGGSSSSGFNGNGVATVGGGGGSGKKRQPMSPTQARRAAAAAAAQTTPGSRRGGEVRTKKGGGGGSNGTQLRSESSGEWQVVSRKLRRGTMDGTQQKRGSAGSVNSNTSGGGGGGGGGSSRRGRGQQGQQKQKGQGTARSNSSKPGRRKKR